MPAPSFCRSLESHSSLMTVTPAILSGLDLGNPLRTRRSGACLNLIGLPVASNDALRTLVFTPPMASSVPGQRVHQK